MGFLLQFVSIVVFAFGAPAFTVLAASYWRDGSRGDRLLRTFTLVCAVVFLANLLSIAFFIDYPVVLFLRRLLVGLLPPMIFHLVLRQSDEIRTTTLLKFLLGLLYGFALLSSLAAVTPWRDRLSSASALVLATASLCSLIMLFRDRRGEARGRRRHLWMATIFLLLGLVSIATLVSENPFFQLAPDYLVLLFFAVHLYYAERLAFFDTFVRWGAFFMVGAVLLGLLLLISPPFRDVVGDDWIAACTAILILMPAWLLAPLLFNLLRRSVDRALDRRFSVIEAEQYFFESLQSCENELQLKDGATSCLEEIFACRASIDFEHPANKIEVDELLCPVAATGHIRLLPRTNGVPFLSDDRRLLATLARSLGVLLQNVRLHTEQREQKRREQELAALASRAELRALRAQINPHFLFNALNAIAGWIRTEPEFADETLAELAEVFRYTLHRSKQEWVRLSEEVDFIRAYLAVERARFRDRLETHVSLDPAAKTVQIPAMVIQPIVENAIKHGISRTAGAGYVKLTITAEHAVLYVEVSDSGPGFPEGFVMDGVAEGHGLRNVADRLHGYYGAAGSLGWKNTAEGTSVTLTIPVRRNSCCES